VQKRKISISKHTDENIFSTLDFDFSRVQLKFAFRIWPFVFLRFYGNDKEFSGIRFSLCVEKLFAFFTLEILPNQVYL